MSKINPELSEQAKRHIRRLKTEGISHSSIARAAGISPSTVSTNMNCERPFTKKTALRLLNITAAIAREHELRPSVELATAEQAAKCRQRIKIFSAHGIPIRALAEEAGLSSTCIKRISSEETHPSRASAEKILSVALEDIDRKPELTVGEMVREEYPFMRSILGHDGAVQRLMDAYNMAESTIRYHLDMEAAA